jgi:hypothetical protein
VGAPCREGNAPNMNLNAPLLLGALAAAGLLQSCTLPMGSACTLDSDCSRLEVNAAEKALGITAFCKQASVDLTHTAGFSYPGGYCTKRCGFAGGACGTDAKCVYALGIIGEYDNICMTKCTGDGQCRTGYGCINDGTGDGVCAPTPDGGLPARVDPGPGRSGPAGGPCVVDTDCKPPSTGFCLSEVLPDGGLRGYPGGQCSAECGARVADPGWCGTSGVCNPVGFQTTDGLGPAVFWECGVGCGGTLDAGCRPSYVCTTTAIGSSSQGQCVPDCRTSGVGCATGSTCNSSGLCF